MGEYADVVPFAEQWAEKVKKEKGEESAEYGGALNEWGDALNSSGKSKEAEPIILKGLEIQKRTLGQNHLETTETLQSLGILYSDIGEYSKAEGYYLQALDLRKNILGVNHQDVASTIDNLGNLYKDMGDYDKAEKFLLEALDIRKKVLSVDHPHMGASFHNLGVFYYTLGDYSKVESYFQSALEFHKKAHGENHPFVAASFQNLAVLYTSLGKFQKAEPLFIKSLEIRKRLLGNENKEVAASLNNIGLFYRSIGSYSKAEPYYLQSLEIFKKVWGEDHRDLAVPINNLGLIYFEMKEFKKAEPYYLQALQINKKFLGENHPLIAGISRNLGSVNSYLGNYLKAEYYFLESLRILNKNLGIDDPEMPSLLNNIGNFYRDINKYSKADTFFLKALMIYKKNLAYGHPIEAILNSNMGLLQHCKGDLKKAKMFYLDWSIKKKNQIKNYFPSLTDSEKEQFLATKLSSYQDEFNTFCVQRFEVENGISTYLYNDQLITKGLLLNNSTKWKTRIRNSGDQKLIGLFKDWEGYQNELLKLYQSINSIERRAIDSLEEKKEKIEKELSLSSEDFATLADKKEYKWTDVKKKLKPGEAAIEMVRVQKFGISKIVTDTSDPKKPTYKTKGLTDTAYYAALIVTPTSKYPEMVLLKNGNALEERWIQVYKNSISQRIPDQTSYNQFWKKIDAKLGPAVKRVYFSPDGVYNSINLNTLQNPKTGKYLLDERDIRLVTNTKDIVTASVSKPNPAYACLVGFPDYNTDKDKRAAVFQKERNHPESWYNLNLTRSDVYSELPGTKSEVENISTILKDKGWKVESLTGEKALEESIKATHKPRVLHIATHGFFQPDTTKGSNPLIHSGLLLTGANKTLSGEKDDKVDDGILTAYEAMNLDLDNTDLVVLSACETGLGEIKNGEGVYGLQRAFKVAGAQSIIMSLWKVSDQATKELMVSFYKNWLGSVSDNSQLSGRLNKRSAFLKAQKELKAKYPNPYYWGAFVMLGR